MDAGEGQDKQDLLDKMRISHPEEAGTSRFDVSSWLSKFTGS